jgi:hypothetical protein
MLPLYSLNLNFASVIVNNISIFLSPWYKYILSLKLAFLPSIVTVTSFSIKLILSPLST